MPSYTKTFRNATRAAFAREAAINAFGPKAITALDEPDFEDRKPHEGPRHIGEVATKVTKDTGQRALRYWLNQAGRADSDAERQAALRTAHEIGRLTGLDADLFERAAA